MCRVKFILSSVLIVFSALLSIASRADLTLELTQGISKAIPIALVPFAGKAEIQARALNKIIYQDLANSGRFALLNQKRMPARPMLAKNIKPKDWLKTQVNDVIVAKVEPIGPNRVEVQVALRQILGTAPVLFNQRYRVSNNRLRALGHYIADQIYQKLIGVRGIFSTRLAYILVTRKNGKRYFRLEVTDADGRNPQTLLASNWPIMSPAWSPNGKTIAYVSFENQDSEIYIVNVKTGKRRLISNYKRINASPAWSPDGKKLAIVLSKTGSSNLYIKNLVTGSLKQLTQGQSISTEPVWAPNGKSIVFTSDRGGSPQLYQLTLSNKKIRRLSFAGPYNAGAAFSPDGKTIVLLHRAKGQDDIGRLDLTQSNLPITLLTTSGFDDSPSVSPNGEMVIYATTYRNRRVLAMTSLDGRVKLRLPSRDGQVQKPAWSPFLTKK